MEETKILCKIRNFSELEFLRKLFKLNSSNLAWCTKEEYPLELVKIKKFKNTCFEIREADSCDVGVLEVLIEYLRKYKNAISIYQVEYIHLFLSLYNVLSGTNDKILLEECLFLLNDTYKDILTEKNLSEIGIEDYNNYKDGYIYDLETRTFYKIININSGMRTVDFLVRHYKSNGIVSTKSRFVEVRMDDLTNVSKNIFLKKLTINMDDEY